MHVEKYGIVYILVFFSVLALTGIFSSFSVLNLVGDETVLTAATLKMLAEKSLRPAYPTNYHMPFGVYIYLPFFIVVLAFLRFSGLFATFDELEIFGILEYAKLLPVARFISVVLGVASVYLVYRICRKLFDNVFIALLAAFLLATSVVFLQLAHFGKVWMPQIFVILLAFYFIAALYKKEQPNLKDYFWPAFWTGISFGTHFIGVLTYVPFLVVHYFKNRERRFAEIFIKDKNLWFANGVIALLVALSFYLNPYGFINYASWSSSSTANIISQSVGAEVAKFNFWRGVSAYARVLFEYCPALTLIFLASLIPLFWRKRDLFFIFASFILGYYFVIGPLIASSARPVPFYIGPIIPFMAMIVAYGIYAFYQSGFLSKKIKLAIIFSILIFSLYMPIMWDYAILRPSSAVYASQWVNRNVPPGSKIVNLGFVLPLNEDKESINDIQKYAPAFFTKRKAYLLSVNEYDYPKPNYYVLVPSFYRDGIPAEVSNRQFDYVITSWYSGWYDSALEEVKSYGAQEKNLVAIFPANASPDSFSADIESIRRPFFSLRKMTHIGPVIAIYKLGK